MKYTKCKRCELNYITQEEDICKVCKAELNSKNSYVEEYDICPICYKNTIDYDQIMCKSCYQKRNKKSY